MLKCRQVQITICDVRGGVIKKVRFYVKRTTYEENNRKVRTEIQITIYLRVAKFFVIETGNTLSSELVLNFWIRNY